MSGERLRVRVASGECGSHLNLDALLSLLEEQAVQAEVLVLGRRTAKEEFWCEPPVEDLDALLRLVQDGRQRLREGRRASAQAQATDQAGRVLT